MSLSNHDSKAHNSHTSNAVQSPIEDVKIKTGKLATSSDSKNTPRKNKKTNNDTPQTSSFSTASQGLTKKEESLIKSVSTREEFDKLIETIKDKYILVWFSATWCGPCKILAIKFHELALKYSNKIEIFKVDIDDLEDLALENEVSTMPSYMIMRNGQKLALYFGSKQQHIDELVEKFLEEKSG